MIILLLCLECKDTASPAKLRLAVRNEYMSVILLPFCNVFLIHQGSPLYLDLLPSSENMVYFNNVKISMLTILEQNTALSRPQEEVLRALYAKVLRHHLQGILICSLLGAAHWRVFG